MVARGLKTRMAFNVALLLLLSAVITDILIVLVFQSVMMRDQIARGRTAIEKIGKHYFSIYKSQNPRNLSLAESATKLLFDIEKVQLVHIVDADGKLLYTHSREAYSLERVQRQTEKVRSSGEADVEEIGYIWALFWWHPSAICVSVPLHGEDRLEGVVTTVIPLDHIYDQLRKYNKPILLYILINTGILTIVALYRLFRLYLRPIDRIIRQADDFQEDGDLFFAFRNEDNELNRLSSALNRMLTRISSDKKKLQITVNSLEKANIELKNAQKEIIRAEKMASIGRLAAGIAHEIGNPIGIVLGYLDMLKQKGLKEEDQTDFLRRTEDEVQRINTIIRQLLDLARPKNTTRDHLSVNAVIEDIASVMQMQPVMADISVDLHLEAHRDTVWGNDDQLRQVFLNLLLNAADAIHGNNPSRDGRIDLRTAVVESTEPPHPGRLQIRFEDNGAGMDTEQLQNIFDPFFTTKEPGKGTGLGLAVSYMILEGMGGSIHADSRPGSGATFIIELPLAGSDTDTDIGETASDRSGRI